MTVLLCELKSNLFLQGRKNKPENKDIQSLFSFFKTFELELLFMEGYTCVCKSHQNRKQARATARPRVKAYTFQNSVVDVVTRIVRTRSHNTRL